MLELVGKKNTQNDSALELEAGETSLRLGLREPAEGMVWLPS